MATKLSIFEYDTIDGSTFDLIADMDPTGEAASIMNGSAEVECFDNKLFFNARERGLWRWDPNLGELIKLLDDSQQNAPVPHTTGSEQHVYSIYTIYDYLVVITDSDIVYSEDGLTFVSMQSPGLNTYQASNYSERPMLVGSNAQGYFTVFNSAGSMHIHSIQLKIGGGLELSERKYGGFEKALSAIVTGSMLYVANEFNGGRVYRFDLTQAWPAFDTAPYFYFNEAVNEGDKVYQLHELNGKLLITSQSISGDFFLYRADTDWTRVEELYRSNSRIHVGTA